MLGLEPQITQGLVGQCKELAFCSQTDGKPLKALRGGSYMVYFLFFFLKSLWSLCGQ